MTLGTAQPLTASVVSSKTDKRKVVAASDLDQAATAIALAISVCPPGCCPVSRPDCRCRTNPGTDRRPTRGRTAVDRIRAPAGPGMQPDVFAY